MITPSLVFGKAQIFPLDGQLIGDGATEGQTQQNGQLVTVNEITGAELPSYYHANNLIKLRNLPYNRYISKLRS